MPNRNALSRLQLAALIAALILGFRPVPADGQVTAGGGGVLVEDFEDPALETFVHLTGNPAPTLVQRNPLAGDQSARVPCLRKEGDEPLILLSPLSADEVQFDGLVDLKEPCAEDGVGFSLVVLLDGELEVGQVRLRPRGRELDVSTTVLTDGGARVSSPWSTLDPSTIASGGLSFHLHWTAARSSGPEDGHLELQVRHRDGSTQLSILLAGVDNDSYRVDQMGLGAIDLSTAHPQAVALRFDDLRLVDSSTAP